jgi:hypothetical protein
VDTLKGISTDDDIGKSGAILEDEDGRVRASVCVAVASVSTIELLVAHVLDTRDGRRSRQNDLAANTGWDVEGLRRDESGHDGSGDCLSELHLEDCWVKRLGSLKKECLKDARSVGNECGLMNGRLLEAEAEEEDDDDDEMSLMGGLLESLYSHEVLPFCISILKHLVLQVTIAITHSLDQYACELGIVPKSTHDAPIPRSSQQRTRLSNIGYSVLQPYRIALQRTLCSKAKKIQERFPLQKLIYRK